MPMAHPSEPRTLVLHALRLKGFADASAVAAHAQLSDDDAAAHLADLAADGLAVHRDGRISGWSLTQDGRRRHHDAVSKELDDAGARDAVHGAYRAFLAVNADVLAACTDWQVRDGGVNDHADAVYDKAVTTRLRELHEKARPVCDRLAAALARFHHYGPRLDHALAKVEAGEHDWFTRPLIDSYHTVWFELHEDLLSTLGIERSKEEVHS